ncbi:kinesin motor domain protein [Ancylostoma ceylanicum]|uniref:Kinesin motor domain protein n=1 Tax=Ancylostoma ceylanicum TaxID=53326 RepID=A0A0D6M933_9BILA|nr:kinesin motor domain protein [Ancylostoma ceylanicum]
MTAEGSEKVKVAVRVRPFNKRELDLGTKAVVRMCNGQTILDHVSDDKQPKTFTFDHSFYSTDPNDPNFASQEEVFNSLGSGVLENAFSGYNACIFAYGQTGSGKSYSMMGTSEQPGIIPRLCNEVFRRIKETTCETLQYKVEVSYMEIYNERVRDLLDPKKSNKHHLKVREHKILGPLVDGLSVLAVDSFQQIASLIEEGNKSRTVAATNMNAESSRSHAVFNITLTQILKDVEKDFTGEKMAKISLVDLAGSERAGKTGAMGKRLEEGGNINKSLTTLGMVISALAERSNGKKEKFIPYRDSVLTWLLKDNLGGNSRTVMIATISPAADNYEETLSTLRYADRAKRIVNHAVVNEDPNARVIRELREEVETLRMQISQTLKEHSETAELRERLAESERLVAQMNKSWEERLKETDTLNKERQRDLAEIGISIESSGIKVEKDRFYLVNLNADPSLNELLVYYINSSAIIGNLDEIETSLDSGLGNSVEDLDKKDGGERTSIVLRGLGVMRRHARLSVVEERGRQRLYVEPLSSEGRVCVNGREISDKTLLRHGNRLLIGMNHFFRVNCPKDVDMTQSVMDESVLFDYDDAWHEVNGDGGGNPISTAVDQYMEQVTLKHQEDKQAALERQYEAFERYIQNLTAGGFTPSTPMTPGYGFGTPLGTPGTALPPFPFPANPKQMVRSKFFYWAQRKEEMFAESLKRLKSDVIRANALTREANMISRELGNTRRQTTYDVTLQIPAANLRPSKIKAGTFVCEPVIVVRRSGMSGSQLWTVAQLENKLIDMREMYNDKLNGVIRESSCASSPEGSPSHSVPQSSLDEVMIDPFFESQEHHNLIGVANVFLEVLFHDMKLDYQVPIISHQGEVAGRLHVQIYRVPNCESDVIQSPEREYGEGLERAESLLGKVITCRVRIKKASSLPESLSHFVFCQYSFFNLTEMLVVAPVFDPTQTSESQTQAATFVFDHEKDFKVVVTEEFLEYVQDDALSIEVWGHRSGGVTEMGEPRLDAEEKNKSLQARWSEVSRRLELWTEFRELNETGQWIPVEVRQQDDVATGGVHQLKQGQQRRLVVGLSLPQHGAGLPLGIDTITSEEDLERIRAQWTLALQSRQKYLEQQLDSLSSISNKSEAELEREHSLMGQWVSLTEERTAVSIPAPNSDIPGAPCDWIPPPGVEEHVPVLFLDLNSDDMTGEMTSDELIATCSWDSSIHDQPALNVPSSSNERVYAIVKVGVRLSHPCSMELVLRKRVCLNIYKKASLTDRIRKRIVGADPLNRTAVYYDVVAHLPKSSHDMEERSSLALMAARHTASTEEEQASGNDDGRQSNRQLSYIEAYTKSIQAVESMLKLDRLRQEVAITNMLSRRERHQRLSHLGLPSQSFRMKRAVSLPNAISLPLNQLPVTSRNGEPITEAHHKPPPPVDTPMSMSTTSMVTSLISPLNEKLCGIDEEISAKNETLPVRSSTVPETLNTSAGRDTMYSADVRNGNMSAASVLTTSSILTSSSTDEENRPDMDILQLNNNQQLGKEKLYLKGICAKNGC